MRDSRLGIFNPITASRRPRARLANYAVAGMALWLAAGVAIYLLGWPPVDRDAWHYAALPIAFAAMLGWGALARALIFSDRHRRVLGMRNTTPPPASYRDIAVGRAQVLARRIAWSLLCFAAVVLGLSVGYDVIAALTGAPVVAATARGLVFLASVATHPLLASVAGIVSLAALAIDIGARLCPADEGTAERFRLAAVADPVVSRYQEDLRRLGRRPIVEDRKRLGHRLNKAGSNRDDEP